METLKRNLLTNFNDFFGDFGYRSVEGENFYLQEIYHSKKAIFLNLTEYKEGVMVEFMLGVSHTPTEMKLNELNENYTANAVQLSYHIYIDIIDNSLPKRTFLKIGESTKYYCSQMESFFVNAGFYWLDEYSKPSKLSNLMALSIIKDRYYDNNIWLMCQRSLLLKKFLEEPITESLFFTYYEFLQEKNFPESQLRAFLDLRSYFLFKT
ncbi:hypothetical protein GCM10027429_20290 [Marivirga atlantica]|uniref:Uncharacterized protein n=1 Tax=Marivirga atlantica TaxID=1548457 RepID=A0A937DEX3_9BACT|nr:hypothetical protein [Marivirga atlantica]MBL0765647.1 hypothetical protein [Marivirga atlantica]